MYACYFTIMRKEIFIKSKIKWIKERIGEIKLDKVIKLPENTKLAVNIKEFLDEFERTNIGEIYFLKNCDNEYYLKITTEDTDLRELKTFIKEKLIYY